jgi:hypothetical protein
MQAMKQTRKRSKLFGYAVTTRIHHGDVAGFEALLRARGVTRSELLRQLVAEAVGTKAGAEGREPEGVTVNS